MSLKDKENYNSYMREYVLARHHRRMEEGKKQLGEKCVSCSTTENLQFDHIDPKTKLFTLAAGGSFSEERWQAEVAKCQLLCQPCHNQKTLKDLNRQDAKTTHGTISSYKYCKCELCKKAKAETNKKYKKIKNPSKNKYQKVKGEDIHGTVSAYRYCKCELCKKAKTDYHRKWRESKRSDKQNENPAA